MFSALFGLSRRLEMVLLLMIGLSVTIMLRVDSSIVAASPQFTAELHWTKGQRGLFLSSLFWGYTIGQLPASLLTKLHGGKLAYLICTLIPGILTLLLPSAIRHSFGLALLVHAAIGLSYSAVFPCMFHYFTVWVPTNEKTFLVALAYNGMYVGAIVGFSVSGYLVITPSIVYGMHVGGWAAVYYVFGLVALVWTPVWYYFAYETPHLHPSISGDELTMFEAQSQRDSQGSENMNISPEDSQDKASSSTVEEDALPEVVKTVSPPAAAGEASASVKGLLLEFPWEVLLTHRVALTCYVNNWTFGFISFLLLTEMPTYFSEVLEFDISTSGVLCIAPYIGLLTGTIGFSRLFTYCMATLGWRVRTIRQLAEFISLGGASVALLICPFLTRRYDAYALIIVSQVLLGAYGSGNACNYLEVSPTYSTIMNTIGNICACVAGILAPIIVAQCTERWKGILGWKVVYGIAFAKSVVALLLWTLFQTSDPVPELNMPSARSMKLSHPQQLPTVDAMEAQYEAV